MKEKMEKYARGEFDEQIPKLSVQKTPLSWEMEPEVHFRGELKIQSENGVRLRGYAITTDGNMKIKNAQFFGTNVKLEFDYYSKNAADGDRKRGKMILITNGGEFMVPFEVQIKKKRADEGELVNE